MWGSLGLPLSLRQWGTCWGDPPALQGSWLLAPQDPPCPMLKAVAYRVPTVTFCPLSFPRASVSPPRGQPLKRLWDRARRSEWEWGLLEHLGSLCQGRGCHGTANPLSPCARLTMWLPLPRGPQSCQPHLPFLHRTGNAKAPRGAFRSPLVPPRGAPKFLPGRRRGKLRRRGPPMVCTGGRRSRGWAGQSPPAGQLRGVSRLAKTL